MQSLKQYIYIISYNIHLLKFIYYIYISTFSLIFHQEDSIKKQVLESFKTIFLTDGAEHNPIYHSNKIIINDFILLFQECIDNNTIYTSLEEIFRISILDENSILDDEFLETLWDILDVIIYALYYAIYCIYCIYYIYISSEFNSI